MPIIRIPVELDSPQLPNGGYNVWHARVDGFTFQFDTPWDALHTFYTSIAGLLTGGMTIRFPDSVVDVETQEETAITAPSPIVTTATGSDLPGIAAVISWSTSIRARRARGRTFIGPTTAATFDQGSGNIQTAAKTTLQNAATALVDASAAVNGWALGVYGQQSAGVAEPKVLRDFTAGKVSPRYAHLRSRRD